MNQVRQQKFHPDRQKRIRSLVTTIRTRNGGNNRTQRNLIFSSSNVQDPVLQQLTHLLIKDLPKNVLRKTKNVRLYLRYVSGGLSNYAAGQRLHRNLISNPTEGHAFMQFIYFLDTPKIGNAEVPANERGVLLLNPGPNTVTTFVPEQGRILFFNPESVFHEVMFPAGRVAGNITRNMIIGFLFTEHNPFTGVVHRKNIASENYATTVRTRLVPGIPQIPYIESSKRLLKSRLEMQNMKRPGTKGAVTRRAERAKVKRRVAHKARTSAARRNVLMSRRYTAFPMNF